MSLNILDSNKKSSRKAKILPQFSISSENKPFLDLLEIQRKSFFDFLQHGISHELAKIAVFRETAKNSTCKQELELKFNPETYKFISPNFTPKEAILNGKTYACKVYVQATLMIRSSDDIERTNFFSVFQKESSKSLVKYKSDYYPSSDKKKKRLNTSKLLHITYTNLLESPFICYPRFAKGVCKGKESVAGKEKNGPQLLYPYRGMPLQDEMNVIPLKRFASKERRTLWGKELYPFSKAWVRTQYPFTPLGYWVRGIALTHHLRSKEVRNRGSNAPILRYPFRLTKQRSSVVAKRPTLPSKELRSPTLLTPSGYYSLRLPFWAFTSEAPSNITSSAAIPYKGKNLLLPKPFQGIGSLTCEFPQYPERAWEAGGTARQSHALLRAYPARACLPIPLYPVLAKRWRGKGVWGKGYAEETEELLKNEESNTFISLEKKLGEQGKQKVAAISFTPFKVDKFNKLRKKRLCYVNHNIQIFRPWIFLGELPLMTKRGHFILNGSPRVIVNQIARCPGIYFQEKRRGVGIEQEIRVSADLIPQRGPWLRIQSDWEGRFWARLKQEGRVKYTTLYEAFQEFEKEYNSPLICLLSNSYFTNATFSLFSKSENVTFQERKIKEDRQKKALIRLFKNSSRYSLGKLGRSRVNERIHSSFTTPSYHPNKEIASPVRSNSLITNNVKLTTSHTGCIIGVQIKEAEEQRKDLPNWGSWESEAGITHDKVAQFLPALQVAQQRSVEPRRVRTPCLASPVPQRGKRVLGESTRQTPFNALLVQQGKPLAKFYPIPLYPSGACKAGGTGVKEQRSSVGKELRYFFNEELMAKDLDAIHTCLERLLEGQGFTDDIDNLKNRFIRTSGKLLQQQFELGLFRLNEVVMPLLGNLLPNYPRLAKGKYSTTKNIRPAKGNNSDSQEVHLEDNLNKVKSTKALSTTTNSKSSVAPASITSSAAAKLYPLRVRTCKGKDPLLTSDPQPATDSGGVKGSHYKSKISSLLIQSLPFTIRLAQERSVGPLAKHRLALRSPYPFTPYPRGVQGYGVKGMQKKQELRYPFLPRRERSVFYKSKICTTQYPRGGNTKSQHWKGKEPENQTFEYSKEGSLIKNAPFRWLRTSKPINSAFREFFGSNPLSQYMDQTNPLAEITHKRRLSSMGPGGIKRETAGMEVRGIHPTHYGRVCPIETPEGKNAGLVNSPTVYSRVGNYGFLETPLYQVIENQVQTKRWTFFSAQHEEKEKSSLATCDTGLLQFNFLAHVPIPVQTANNPLTHFQQVERHRVGYRALSPIQTISIATALIPFLEHDDANRALMGSNMQRQAIPLLSPERPIVGTGFEPLVVIESGQALQATKLGCVSQADANSIIVHTRYSIEKPLVQGKQNILQDSNLPWSRALVHRFGIKDTVVTPSHSPSPLTHTPLPHTSKALKGLAKLGGEMNAGLAYPYPCTQYERSVGGVKGYGVKGLQKQQKDYSQLLYPYRGMPLQGMGSFAIHHMRNKIAVKGVQYSFATHHMQSKVAGRRVKRSLPHTLEGYRGITLRDKQVRKGNSRFRKPRITPIGVANLFEEQIVTQFDNYANKEHISYSHNTFFLQPLKQDLQFYERSNQETCLSQRPLVQEGDWIQKGDFLADSSASHSGDLALGKNVTVAYMPWEGYNFEDAIVISDRLVSDDIYTSLHIERYEIKVSKNSQGKERITNRVPGTSHSLKHLDNFGIARLSSWVQPGDILVGKVVELKRPLSPYERLAWELASRLSPKSPEREKWLNKVWLEDISLRLPPGICGRVINSQIISTEYLPLQGTMSDKEQTISPQEVHIYLAVKRKIQIGDKLAGRHGNKGIVSAILPQEDMPYLGDGSCIDMVLNPLGVPSRMNLGQIFECLLGLAGSQLGCNFRITPFDEIAGGEASRSLVFLKLYQCRLMYKQQWLFTPTFPGKSKLFDGRTGEPFENWVTVGRAYMLKLIHMVDHKIHARSTGPYSLFTRQPVRGRSRRGGQRLGEMEVWAVEGFGAAYTLQEFLTIKSDDLKARTALQKGFYKQNDITFGKIHIAPGNPEAFKVLVSELQALCLHIQM